MNIASLLGVDASELLSARSTAEGMARDLRRIADTLTTEVGGVPSGAVAHSRARTPFMRTVELEAPKTGPGVPKPPTLPVIRENGSRDFGAVPPSRASIPYESLLGRPATRGHIRNVGPDPFLVRIRGAADDWSDYYELHSGQELDHSSWMVTALEIVTMGPYDARAQVLAQ